MERKQGLMTQSQLADLIKLAPCAARVDPSLTYINVEGQIHAITRQHSSKSIG